MSGLEKFINENRGEFDLLEPSEGHFDRFLARLGQEPAKEVRITRRFYLMRIAAAVLLLVTFGLIGFDLATHSLRSQIGSFSVQGSLSDELKDALAYYDHQTGLRMEELQSIISRNADYKSLIDETGQQLNDLDHSIHDLKAQLASCPGNEQIEAAIILNQQMKQSVLDAVIRKISSGIQP